jgi:hypothetical protein
VQGKRKPRTGHQPFLSSAPERARRVWACQDRGVDEAGVGVGKGERDSERKVGPSPHYPRLQLEAPPPTNKAPSSRRTGFQKAKVSHYVR